jgi:hypothetical protein
MCAVEQKCVNEKIVTVRSKREQTDVASEKAAKVAKISDSWTPQNSGHRWEKENVDPQYIGSDADLGANFNKAGNLHKSTPQVSFNLHVYLDLIFITFYYKKEVLAFFMCFT